MSPEARGTAAGLARLLAEIGEDRAAMDRQRVHAEEAVRRLERDPTDPGALALASVALHGWYTGLETAFERVAREIDGVVPEGDRWHRELLSQMSIEVPGLRPALVAREAVTELTILLGFRHFFRHAYAVTFDAEVLRERLATLLAVSGPVALSMDAFTVFARDSLEAVQKM